MTKNLANGAAVGDEIALGAYVFIDRRTGYSGEKLNRVVLGTANLLQNGGVISCKIVSLMELVNIFIVPI